MESAIDSVMNIIARSIAIFAIRGGVMLLCGGFLVLLSRKTLPAAGFVLSGSILTSAGLAAPEIFNRLITMIKQTGGSESALALLAGTSVVLLFVLLAGSLMALGLPGHIVRIRGRAGDNGVLRVLTTLSIASLLLPPCWSIALLIAYLDERRAPAKNLEGAPALLNRRVTTPSSVVAECYGVWESTILTIRTGQ